MPGTSASPMTGPCCSCGLSASKASTWIGGWRHIVSGAVVVRNAESARWASPPRMMRPGRIIRVPVVHESAVRPRFPRSMLRRRDCFVDSYNSWAPTNNGCGCGCPQCGVWSRSVVRGCAPIMGPALVVRNAESSPAAGFCGGLLVEWWRSSPSVYAGVLDVRYSTSAPQEAPSWLRVLAPRLMWPPVDRSHPAGWCRPGCSQCGV